MVKTVDYIITARHISPDGTGRGYYLHFCSEVKRLRGVRLDAASLDNPSGPPIKARVYQGQWIADCECTGASYVDPDFPSFMCFSCGNRANDGKARPVEFPADRAQIEAALLERPVNDIRGLTDADRAGMAQPLVFVEGKGGLSRNWMPHEKLEDLRAQQDKPLAEWKKANKGKR